MKSPIENKVLINFYEEADGPTIRIDVQSKKHWDYFVGLFYSLSKNCNLKINLNAVDFIQLSGIKEITLNTNINLKMFKQAIFIDKNPDGSYSCKWTNPPSGWEKCAELIAPPRRTNRHQYLTEDTPLNDATVEFAYMETRIGF